MLDVLEHIADDAAALANIAHMLRPGGHLLLTVPALPARWSAHDEANHHFRRYRRRGLRRLLIQEGLEIVEAHYLFGWSLGLLCLRRWLPRQENSSYRVRVPPRWANSTCLWLSRLEASLTQILPCTPPLGSSLLFVARTAIAGRESYATAIHRSDTDGTGQRRVE